MRLVVDANIIMAMLIKPSKPVDAFFHHQLRIYAPELLFTELENNRKEILEKSSLNREQFESLFAALKRNMAIVPSKNFLSFLKRADEVCPDPKDIVYFALAIHLKCGIWSNEKILKKQGRVEVYATHDLIKLLKI